MMRWLCPSVALLAVLAACAPARPRSQAEQALDTCRHQADQMFLQQNRGYLLQRDTRDSPFSSSGMVGNTAAGLGDRYGHDAMVESCVANANRPQPADGTEHGAPPTLAPVSPRLGPAAQGP